MVSGCATCDPKPVNPCDPDPCNGHGTCSAQDNAAACACESKYSGDRCQLFFDPSSYLASKVFCPADSGRVEIAGATGDYAGMNGYYADIPANAFDRCVWVLLTPALGTNLPDPGRNGRIIAQAKGIEIMAVDQLTPILPNGDLNQVQPGKDVGLLFKGHRGTVLLFLESGSRFEDIPFAITAEGSLGSTRHFSPFYLLDTKPAISATASQVSGTNVSFDYTGTTDEQSSTSHFLSFSASAGGIPLTLTSSGDHRFQTTLPGGTHSITLKVLDPNGSEDTKTQSLNVDLCTGNTCLNWQTCREADGVCVGSNPCTPNPCLHSGTCSPTGTATYSCTCATGSNWTGPICSICPAGFYEDGTGSCVTDHCYNVTCDDGNPCNGTETCNQATGCVAGTPVVCPDDGNLCNGTEQCNAVSGTCTHENPLVCDDSLVCNGTETCNPTAGCQAGTAVSCSSHGNCQEPPLALCQCNGNWTGPNCATCPAGYTGADCHVDLCYGNTCSGHGTCNASTGLCGCDTGYDGATCNACATDYGPAYPTCNPKPTITGLAIDCSGWPGYGTCIAGGTYNPPVMFNSTNATGWSAVVTKLSGTGTPGSASPTGGVITGISTSFTYVTGSDGLDVNRVTVTVTGPGGQASASADVTLY